MHLLAETVAHTVYGLLFVWLAVKVAKHAWK